MNLLPPPPMLSHTVNSSGRLGMFVNPHACSCHGCQDFLTSIEEPPGFSNLAPPSALNLERQTAAPTNCGGASPTFSPVSHTSTTEMTPVHLPQRSNGGGIETVAIGPTTSGVDWRALYDGFRSSRWETSEVSPVNGDDQSGLCHCGPCTGIHENTGMPQELRDELLDHLTNYLTMLEKHQKVMVAKMDLYSFLLEDASVRLRLEGFNKKILAVKETLDKLD